MNSSGSPPLLDRINELTEKLNEIQTAQGFKRSGLHRRITEIINHILHETYSLSSDSEVFIHVHQILSSAIDNIQTLVLRSHDYEHKADSEQAADFLQAAKAFFELIIDRASPDPLVPCPNPVLIAFPHSSKHNADAEPLYLKALRALIQINQLRFKTLDNKVTQFTTMIDLIVIIDTLLKNVKQPTLKAALDDLRQPLMIDLEACIASCRDSDIVDFNQTRRTIDPRAQLYSRVTQYEILEQVKQLPERHNRVNVSLLQDLDQFVIFLGSHNHNRLDQVVGSLSFPAVLTAAKALLDATAKSRVSGPILQLASRTDIFSLQVHEEKDERDESLREESEREVAQTLSVYQISAALGNQTALRSLAIMYFIGIGVPQDTKSGLSLLADSIRETAQHARSHQESLVELIKLLDHPRMDDNASCEVAQLVVPTLFCFPSRPDARFHLWGSDTTYRFGCRIGHLTATLEFRAALIRLHKKLSGKKPWDARRLSQLKEINQQVQKSIQTLVANIIRAYDNESKPRLHGYNNEFFLTRFILNNTWIIPFLRSQPELMAWIKNELNTRQVPRSRNEVQDKWGDCEIDACVRYLLFRPRREAVVADRDDEEAKRDDVNVIVEREDATADYVELLRLHNLERPDAMSLPANILLIKGLQLLDDAKDPSKNRTECQKLAVEALLEAIKVWDKPDEFWGDNRKLCRTLTVNLALPLIESFQSRGLIGKGQAVKTDRTLFIKTVQDHFQVTSGLTADEHLRAAHLLIAASDLIQPASGEQKHDRPAPHNDDVIQLITKAQEHLELGKRDRESNIMLTEDEVSALSGIEEHLTFLVEQKSRVLKPNKAKSILAELEGKLSTMGKEVAARQAMIETLRELKRELDELLKFLMSLPDNPDDADLKEEVGRLFTWAYFVCEKLDIAMPYYLQQAATLDNPRAIEKMEADAVFGERLEKLRAIRDEKGYLGENILFPLGAKRKAAAAALIKKLEDSNNQPTLKDLEALAKHHDVLTNIGVLGNIYRELCRVASPAAPSVAATI